MATHKISYNEGDEANLDATAGMAVVVGGVATGAIDVTIDQAVIGRDAAYKGLLKIAELVRKNDFPLA